MDLDEIQSVQSRERQTDSLQQLRDSFYEEAGEFVRALREERERAAERADDPFDAPEVNRLSDDIATAEQTLEAIYERRVGKIVKMASLAAADMPTEDEGLTTEERELFESLVASIEDSREHVFDVLEGETNDDASVGPDRPTTNEPQREPPVPEDEASSVDGSAETEPVDDATEPAPDEISAADLMGSEADTTTEGSETDATAENTDMTRVPPDEPPVDATAGEVTRGDGGSQAVEPSSSTSDPHKTDRETPEAGEAVAEGVDRTTVRITDDVGEILGVDDRAYDLSAHDVVTLPETNAGPLIERGAAERLD